MMESFNGKIPNDIQIAVIPRETKDGRVISVIVEDKEIKLIKKLNLIQVPTPVMPRKIKMP